MRSACLLANADVRQGGRNRSSRARAPVSWAGCAAPAPQWLTSPPAATSYSTTSSASPAVPAGPPFGGQPSGGPPLDEQPIDQRCDCLTVWWRPATWSGARAPTAGPLRSASSTGA